MQANDLAALQELAAPDTARALKLGQTWLRHMRRGDFEAAWKISDEVLALRRGRSCAHLPRHLQWVWNGKPLDGKRVLIRCYHGLGDTVQFIRYATLVKNVASHVSVWAQPELLPLLQTMPAAFDDLLSLHDGSPECNFDVDVELMELPHLFRTTLATVPDEIPYFHLKPAQLPHGDKVNVGLVWTAGEWDERRSIPFQVVRGLARLPGLRWHILQRGSALDEWDGEFGINSGSDDVLLAAQTIAALDLLISIDSLPAHLGGALGVRTWTLLQHDADWRWMIGPNDSPWYPTMRLFRQPRLDDWPAVIEAVKVELRNRFRSSRRTIAASVLR